MKDNDISMIIRVCGCGYVCMLVCV